MFHVSVIAPNAIMVIYGILFGGMHPVTSYNKRFSSISSSLSPSKSQHQINPFDVLREESGGTLIETLASEVNMRQHLECLCQTFNQQ